MRAQKRETKRTHISQVRHLRGTGAVCRRVRWNTSPLAGTQAPPGTQARCRKAGNPQPCGTQARWNTSPLVHKPLWNTRHVHTDLAPWTLKRRARARNRRQTAPVCFVCSICGDLERFAPVFLRARARSSYRWWGPYVQGSAINRDFFVEITTSLN